MSPVTVWWARRQDARPELTALLDDTEHERFTSYLHQPSRERFLAGCSLAKAAVAAARGVDPREVTLDRSCARCGEPHGKPRVSDGDLELSVSHSGDRVAVAITRKTPIGVDVEETDGRARGGDDPGALERYVLSDAEQAAFDREPAAADRRRNFLVIWTRKEAVLKATGDGLNVPLHDLVVAAPSAQPAVLAWPYPDPPDRVTLLDLDAGPGYVAALAVLGQCEEVISQDGTALLAAALTR
ncbi:MAG TPA: 4'-phosphopantetheinyl transferase superfamily protein [Streptosporangiaceae bacterium]|nr:4'-phosphopantetheinyl transferase superfamily protein [Streptosporangiaceae bacterium]